MITMNDFETAARMFCATPCPDALNLLTSVGQAVMTAKVTRETNPFVTVADGADLPCDWQEIRATFGRELLEGELFGASGAIGYALRIYMAGEELSLPRVVSAPGQPTVAVYGYDSTKSRRSEADPIEALQVAVSYISEGSPIRRTNRAGVGSRGTRLVQGIGQVAVSFAVR